MKNQPAINVRLYQDILLSTSMKNNTRIMDSIRATPVSKRGGAVGKRLVISMTPPPAIARLQRTKQQFDGEEDQNLLKKRRESPGTSVPGLNLPKPLPPLHTSPITPVTAEKISKKLFTSPVTPATPVETSKELPNIGLMTNIALMNVSPEPTTSKAGGASGYDFDKETVSTQDDDEDFFRPYTQKPKPIVINSISPISPTSPIFVGSLHGKTNSLYGKVVKDGHQKRVHFNKNNLKSIKAEVERPTSSDLQLMGESYIHIFFHIEQANLE